MGKALFQFFSSTKPRAMSVRMRRFLSYSGGFDDKC